MTATSTHSRACFEAWMNCEQLLQDTQKRTNNLSKQITKVIDECALICMGTFHAIKSQSQNIHKMALLCIGICEECAEICESVAHKEFNECARICRQCSTTMSGFASSRLQ